MESEETPSKNTNTTEPTEMENQDNVNETDGATATGVPNPHEADTQLMETEEQDMDADAGGQSEKEDETAGKVDQEDPTESDDQNPEEGEKNAADADSGESGEDKKVNAEEKQDPDPGEDEGATAVVRESKTRRSIRRASTEEAISRKRTGSSVSGDEAPRKKVVRNNSISSKQGGGQPKPQQGVVDESHDKYCWVCHKEGVIHHCKICPRSFHPKCLNMSETSDASKGEGVSGAKAFVCPECTLVMKAENVVSRSDAMKTLSQEELGKLLQYTCNRLRSVPGVQPFLNPVKSEDAEDYYDFIVYPMDMYTLENNLKAGMYGSTEAFMSDAQWIVHNSVVFNSMSSVYTHSAKKFMKICKQELAEIETCSECYTNAHENPQSWFLEACARPHLLVWAKLKGFPYWPAKAMKIKDDQVDVRFFGEHDRAWVKLADCVHYMVECPVATKKPGGLPLAVEELNQHVEKLKEKFGEVTFATEKTPIGPNFSVEQIRRLLPQYTPEIISVREEEPKSLSLEAKYQLRKPKTSESSTSGSEANSSAKQDENAEPEVPEGKVPDGEILANALGLTRINKDAPKKSTRVSTSESNVGVKQEPKDIPEEAVDQESPEPNKKGGAKTKNLMEQISNQTQSKPGYRFNISKDISISAIDDNEDDSDPAEVKKVTKLPPSVSAGHPKNVGNQRYVVGKDGKIRPLVKPGEPMKAPMRTSMQSTLQPSMRKTKDGSYQSLTGEGSAGIVKPAPAVSQQQGQGGITLPGGSITVTPLSNAGRPTAVQGARGANGLPMNGGNSAKFGKALRAQQQITRNFGPSVSASLPPSVRILVQNCLKTCEEQISSTLVTAIADNQSSTTAVKVESAGGAGDKDQVQRLQQRLQRYEKEITDMKHSHGLVVKELKASYEKRMAELKRMFEEDKRRQASELKKKQWCASCGREAMFYCCWNTSYCGYECQEEHWPAHMTSCSQGQNRNQISNQVQLQNGGR